MKPDLSLRQSTGLVAVALPVVLFVALLSRQLSNIPLWDDYPSILGFACDWQVAADWKERCSLLFGQYFSHRIVLTRLCVLATQGLTGEVNFLLLQILGLAAWVSLFALLARRWRAESRSWWLLLPVACVLMQPQAFSNHLIGMQAVQNIGVLLWSFLALDLASRSHPAAFPAAVGLAATAPFVSANGLLLAPVLALLLATTGRWRRLPIVVVAGGLAWAVYFTGFVKPATPFNLGEFINNAATMAGAPLALLTLDHHAARVAGLLLLGLAAGFLLRPATWRSTPVAAAWLTFVVLSILLAARGRIGWGELYMLQDRYRVYGMLLIALLYWQIVPLLAPRAPRLLATSASTLAAIFCLFSYHSSWPVVLNEAAAARGSAYNRQLGRWYPEISGDAWSDSARLLERAESAGVYRLPALLPAATVAWLMAPPATAAQGTVSARPRADGFTWVIVPGAGQSMPDFGLLAGEAPLAVPLLRTRSRLVDLLRHGQFAGSTHSFALVPAAVPDSSERFLAVGLQPDDEPVALWQAPFGGL